MLQQYKGGENFDLRDILLQGKRLSLRQRVSSFSSFLKNLSEQKQFLCMRCITSAADREVTVVDPYSGREKTMLMFGSNNYLGLANHRYVREYVERTIREYGVGIGGPPLLNGYTNLHRELELRLAALKGTEDAMIFSTGYGANVGLVTGLVAANDRVICDTYSHASFSDGVKMSGARSFKFAHNDVARLRKMLELHCDGRAHEVFVGVEGVYSMDGDLAPLDVIVRLCREFGAVLMLDDAHGTGIMGEHGRGTAEHFGVEGNVDITMGTFSKTFGAVGGFVAASKPVIDYLRFFARPYMFSASLPPTVVATVLAGLDVMEHEPGLIARFRENVRYAAEGLRGLGFELYPQSGIIPLRVPIGMNIRSASFQFHERGIFMNSIEYPAVPVSQQRFRISIMATHTRQDIDRLLTAVDAVWTGFRSGTMQSETGSASAANC